MAQVLKTVGVRILAGICLFLGLLTIWTPIPTGAILLALGTALLLMTSKRAVRVVRKIRRRFPKLDDALHIAEYRLPSKLAKTLRRTNVRIRGSEGNSADVTANVLQSKRKPPPKMN